MTTAVLRKELQGYIAKMPERRLRVLQPLLSEMAEPLYIVEKASLSEAKRAEKRIKEFHDDPSCFVALK